MLGLFSAFQPSSDSPTCHAHLSLGLNLQDSLLNKASRRASNSLVLSSSRGGRSGGEITDSALRFLRLLFQRALQREGWVNGSAMVNCLVAVEVQTLFF